jgi:hypothetical protein
MREIFTESPKKKKTCKLGGSAQIFSRIAKSLWSPFWRRSFSTLHWYSLVISRRTVVKGNETPGLGKREERGKTKGKRGREGSEAADWRSQGGGGSRREGRQGNQEWSGGGGSRR